MGRSTPPRAGGQALRASASGGFSLVELLAVVAIIGVTMLMFRPSFVRSEQRTSLEQETNSIQRVIGLARSRAIASRRYVAVEFDLRVYPAGDTVRMLEDAAWDSDQSRWIGTETADGEVRVVGEPLDIRRVKVGSTSYFQGYHYIVFTPTGTGGMDDGGIIGPLDIEVVHMAMAATAAS